MDFNISVVFSKNEYFMVYWFYGYLCVCGGGGGGCTTNFYLSFFFFFFFWGGGGI